MKQGSLFLFRILAGFWIPIYLLGWVWFGTYFSTSEHITMAIVTFSLFVAAITTKESYAGNKRYMLGSIFSFGFFATCLDMYNSYTASYGPDYGAMVLQTIVLCTFVVFIIKTISLNKEIQEE